MAKVDPIPPLPPNPSAFPVPHFSAVGVVARSESSSGMTLLDYFAGCALQGMLSDPDVNPSSLSGFAESCYSFAAAMLEERMRRIDPLEQV